MGLLMKLPLTRVAGRSSSTVRKRGDPWCSSLGCQKTLWIADLGAGGSAGRCAVRVCAEAASANAVRREIERRCMLAGPCRVMRGGGVAAGEEEASADQNWK